MTNASSPRPDARHTLTRRVLHAVEHVTWPAHPGTLIDSARRSGAPPDVLDALRALPDEAFGSFQEVSASLAMTQRGDAAPRVGERR